MNNDGALEYACMAWNWAVCNRWELSAKYQDLAECSLALDTDEGPPTWETMRAEVILRELHTLKTGRL